MANFYLNIQSPEIELPLNCKDGAGEKFSCLIGFKRHNRVVAKEMLDKLTTNLDEVNWMDSIYSMLRENVLYFKRIKLTDSSTGKDKNVEDSRTILESSPFYSGNINITGDILDLIDQCIPLRNEIIMVFQRSLANSELDKTEAAIKN